MKKILFLCAVFLVLAVNAQKLKNAQIDCSSKLKELVKARAYAWYENVYDYNINSYEKNEATDTSLLSSLRLYYLKKSLKYSTDANNSFNTDRKIFEDLGKEADRYHNMASTLSSLDKLSFSKKLGITIYSTKYRIKGDQEDENFSTDFYFDKKCNNLSYDGLYDYVIENIER